MEEIIYHNISSQIILICIFLAGFSATILGNFVNQKEHNNIAKAIIFSLLIATCSLLISVFLLTDLFIQTSEGYPSQFTRDELQDRFVKSTFLLLIGVASFMTFIGLTGWLNSRRAGIITTILAFVTFVSIMMALDGS